MSLVVTHMVLLGLLGWWPFPNIVAAQKGRWPGYYQRVTELLRAFGVGNLF